ncbi:hypothetical protein SKAU_G00393590 [Synaphobranchus kaupii]|uniref:Uncharacterized protein n=1 Tax=Synaphobranchus kaupii TaxID=118154 RepID=A0A9Q1IDV7_SYNKA|nr:hypothetical protein SKAU_G00393590 [Synaphobranchus kaupii]
MPRLSPGAEAQRVRYSSSRLSVTALTGAQRLWFKHRCFLCALRCAAAGGCTRAPFTESPHTSSCAHRYTPNHRARASFAVKDPEARLLQKPHENSLFKGVLLVMGPCDTVPYQ